MISIERLARALGENPETLTEDRRAQLAQTIAGATAWVETQTRRYFGPPRDALYYLRGLNNQDLPLPEVPQPTDSDEGRHVMISCATPAGRPPVPIEADDAQGWSLRVAMDEKSALLKRHGTVWRQDSEYLVSFVEGYATDAGPADVADLVEQLCVQRLGVDPAEVNPSMRGETIGGYSYSRWGGSDLEGIVGGAATLAAWRRLIYA